MNCKEVRSFIHAYVDGEFEQRERLEFEYHISQCPECREEVMFYQSLCNKMKKGCPRTPMPESVERCIFQALKNETRWNRNWFHFTFAAALTFVVFVGGALVFPSWFSDVPTRLTRAQQSFSQPQPPVMTTRVSVTYGSDTQARLANRHVPDVARASRPFRESALPVPRFTQKQYQSLLRMLYAERYGAGRHAERAKFKIHSSDWSSLCDSRVFNSERNALCSFPRVPR